jgi:Ca2+-transporting ATPase
MDRTRHDPLPPTAPPGPTDAARGAGAHADTVATVANGLIVDPAIGLATDEVARRRALHGPNELEAKRGDSAWRIVLDAATEPFVLLLAIAGGGAVLLGEVRDGLLVLAALLPIVGADAVTEYRGEHALEALRAASAPRARVRRSGVAGDLPAADLVPGDVVLLRTGDVVPADLRISRADRLLIDRSILTGESIPEPASTDPDPPAATLADRRSIAYSGTSVVGGRGEGVAIATGAATEVGHIAGGIGGRERTRSPLERELDRLVRILLVVALALIAITTGLGFARGNPLGANLLAGISAAIAAIPEEPPVLLAVILGLGAYRLLRRGVLVRRLNAEEVLGAVDLVITDKTGTLTRNRLEVVSIGDAAGPVTDPSRRAAILGAAIRAEDDAWVQGDGAVAGSFTQALRRAAEANGADPLLDPASLVAVEPVADGHPYSMTVARRGDRPEAAALGAPEAILDLVLAPPASAARERQVDGLERERWHRAIEGATSAGERVVALATGDGRDWAIEALIGFADPVRPGIAEAVAAARAAGIHVVVVTGDHPVTAAAIARQIGLDQGRVEAASELEQLDPDALAGRLDDLAVVARSTPDDKRRLVTAARAAGRLVAVTGDGVNDAPALHGADVAVAMGSGTAVAKEASDLVLGDDSFATLVFGIGEGRRIVDNVEKGLVFIVSTHVALLGFLLIATLAGYSQPLLPIQILWLELFIDLSTSVAFEREPAEPNLLQRPPRPVGRPLLTTSLLARVSVAGGFSALAALWLMSGHEGSADHVRWLAYTALVCGQAVRAYANRSIRLPVHRLGVNGFLLLTAVAVVVVQAAIPYVPPLAEAFRATPLDPTDWTLIAAVALAPALLAQLIRTFSRRVWVA